MSILSELTNLAGVVGGVISFGGLVGAYIAGQRSYSRTLIDAKQKEADGWHRLYDLEKEENAKLNERIDILIRDGHEKDKQISELTGQVRTIESFMKSILSKETLAAAPININT